MKKTIEFQPSSSSTADLVGRWPSSSPPFEDRILTDEYAEAKGSLPRGKCTIRVLPKLKGARYWWMPIHALTYPGGHHAHPKTLEPKVQSVFDRAIAWFKQNAPKALYSKETGKGFKLWTQPMAATWLLVNHEGQTQIRLLVASAFAGTKDRYPGLSHQLLKFIERNKFLLDPDETQAIEVTRWLPEGEKFLETEFEVIDTPHSLNECLAGLPSEKIRMICPVEATIRRIEEEEEWKILERAIGTQWVDLIRKEHPKKESPEGGDRAW